MVVILTSIALFVLKEVPLLVSYINNNSFPHPLSKDDEARYFQILQRSPTNSESDGSAEVLQREQARNILIEHNLRLVVSIVKRFGETEEKNEDLFSIGMIGLIKAINTFKPNIGVKLSTYAGRCITNQILMEYRKDKGKLETSLFKPIGQDDSGNELSLMDSLIADNQSIPDQIANEDDRRILREKLEKLPLRDRQILEMRYGFINNQRHSQQEIADALGISRSYVSRIEKKALRKLGHKLKES